MRNPSVVRSKTLRKMSKEGQSIVTMLLEALDGGHTVRGNVGRFWLASLQIFGRSKPKASLRLVRCDESTGRPFGRARTIVTPIHDWRDPLSVAATLEQQAFLSARQRAVRSSIEGQRSEFYRPNAARHSSH